MQGSTIALKEIRDVADGTRLFVFEKPEGYTFKAGQYVALMAPKKDGIDIDKRGLARSFSISSAPCEPDLYFTMRQGDSSFKCTMWQLGVGEQITITKAVGFFVLPTEEDIRPVVFLAGGIGITPVRSILKQAEYEKSKRPFTLLYSNRFAKDAAFSDEIQNLVLPQFRYVTILSKSETPCEGANEERGYICDMTLDKYISHTTECLYYIVGSPEFSEAMEALLIARGVPKENRHMDPFTGLRVSALDVKQ